MERGKVDFQNISAAAHHLVGKRRHCIVEEPLCIGKATNGVCKRGIGRGVDGAE